MTTEPEIYNIYVRRTGAAEGLLFAQTHDLAEAMAASDWIVNGNDSQPGIPGVVAAWVKPGETGDILADDEELTP